MTIEVEYFAIAIFKPELCATFAVFPSDFRPQITFI